MKILYDISVLGLGHVEPKARTGIFRVIENVAERLVLHTDCEVKFCGLSYSAIKNSIAYLKEQHSLSGVPISIAGLPKRQGKRFDLIQSLADKPEKSLLEKLPVKLQIRSLWLKEKLYSFSQGGDNFIEPADLRKADIYHSPFYPIPEQVKKSGVKSVFLTSYDLIPILHPQFVDKQVIGIIKDVLNTITPDTWVLCISEATRQDLLQYLGNKVDPDKVKVTPLAASDTFYRSTDTRLNKQVREKYGIPDAPYLLSLCTLEPRKNIDQAIRAFARMVAQENIPDLNLVLVGTKGWMFDKIFSEIEASAEIKDRIFVTGYVPDQDLAPLYSDALMFVYPSFYEGFGLPPLEAMQCGTPVITSNTSSLPEVVGDAGIMVSPTDLDALCQAMLTIYQKPAKREQMVVQSLARAGKFSWERCADETVEAYKASLNI